MNKNLKFSSLLKSCGVIDYIKPKVLPGVIDWIESNVDLTHDTTSAADGLVKLDRYQIEPIMCQFMKEVQEVVVMACPQTGKSFVWRLPMLY